jgi:Flp pilus assembly protein TadD
VAPRPLLRQNGVMPRLRIASRALALSLALAAPAARAAGAAVPEPWGAEPFSADPKAILAAARALPPPRGAPVDVLLEDGTLAFDDQGRLTFTYRLVYRPLSREAARAWARVERGWAPWHQARPEIRARVVTPSGGVHLLDPRTLTETEVGEADDEIYSDRRVLKGPLPGLVAGAVVEEVSVVRDVNPLFDAGAIARFWLGQPNPVRLVRLRIDAPSALPLKWAVRGADLKPAVTERDGRRRLLFERRDSPPRAALEPYAPRDALAAPHVLVTTGRSWEEVARRYGQLADERLRGSDLAGIAARVVPAGTPRAAAVRLLTAWVHQNVRYTGLELGEAALVPVSPDETLGRRYGDCKDLSLLLVGLLRAAGHEAHIALLKTGWSEVEPELPGLGEFDHAIVRVDGPEPTWVDPTDPFVAPGRLPAPDQGRLALVARPGTRGLERTPSARADESRARTVREIWLAELGRGRLTEVRELTGALAAEQRAVRAREADGAPAEALARYGREVFKADRVVGGHAHGLDDPASPVELRVEVEGSEVAQTDDDEAGVPATPDPIFGDLPPFLRGEPEEGEEAAAPGARERPLQLPERYQAEMVYRVHPPVGFRPRPLPPEARFAFGPARYTARYAAEPDGAVTATFTFDTGDGLLSPAEAQGLAREVTAIVQARSPVVGFERIGAALLAQGRATEALAEMERLAKLHPGEATHRLHLAVACMQLGQPIAAVAEARRAIALEPARAWAHRVLALALQYDAVGRFRGPGFDRAGALAAFRRARELDPKHAGGRAGLAGLLAVGPDGRAPGPAGDLAAALVEWRSIREELGDKRYEEEHARALLSAGRLAEAAATARGLDAGEERDAILLAALAAAEGPATAEAEARRLSPEAARAGAQHAVGLLLPLRRYAEASALASLAARGAQNGAELRAQAELIGAARRWEAAVAEGDEPTRVVRRILAAVVLEPDPAAALDALSVARAEKRKRPGPDGSAAELRSALLPGERRLGAPPVAILDIALGRLEVVRDGELPGFLRLRVRVPWAATARGSSILLAKEKGAWRLLATDDELPEVGLEALRLADAGDLPAARRLLDWALDDLPAGTAGGSAPQDVITALWRRDAAAPAPAVRRAAAALAAWGHRPEAAAALLERTLADAPPAQEAQAVRWALTVAYRRLERFEPLARVAAELLAQEPGSRPALGRRLHALQRVGRRADLEQAAEAARAAAPDDPVVRSLVASAQLAAGDLDGAARTYRALLDSGKGSAADYNNAAWLALWSEPVAETAVDWARRAVEGSGRRAYASLNTLAAVLAAAGRPGEARELFLQALAAKAEDRIEGADWVVHGLVAERYGFLDAARAAYALVKDGPDDDPTDPTRPSAYAARRLAKLPPAK